MNRFRVSRWPSRSVGTAALALMLLLAPELLAQAEPAAPPACDGERAWAVRGTVVDRHTGIRLPGAEVGVAEAPEPEAEITWAATAAADGSYVACAPDAASPSWLRARWDGTVSEAVEVLPPATDVVLRVDRGKPALLLFSVREAEGGRPVEGAGVRLEPIGMAAATDTLGRIVFQRVPPGGYRVSVSHLAFQTVEDTVRAEPDGSAELRVPLARRAVGVEPLRVTVTGRDAFLVNAGFYERMNGLREGYFALGEEIHPYHTLRTLLTFKRELLLYYGSPALVLVNGRPMRRLGYRSLNEIPLHRVRGLEAIRCGELPSRYMHFLEGSLDCNAMLLWVW